MTRAVIPIKGYLPAHSLSSTLLFRGAAAWLTRALPRPCMQVQLHASFKLTRHVEGGGMAYSVSLFEPRWACPRCCGETSAAAGAATTGGGGASGSAGEGYDEGGGAGPSASCSRGRCIPFGSRDSDWPPAVPSPYPSSSPYTSPPLLGPCDWCRELGLEDCSMAAHLGGEAGTSAGQQQQQEVGQQDPWEVKGGAPEGWETGRRTKGSDMSVYKVPTRVWGGMGVGGGKGPAYMCVVGKGK